HDRDQGQLPAPGADGCPAGGDRHGHEVRLARRVRGGAADDRGRDARGDGVEQPAGHRAPHRMTSPTGGYHRAPDPYVGFDGTDRSAAPRSADRLGAPVTDAPVSPSHAPPVATAPSPYLVPSGPPTTWSPSGAPGRRAGAGAGCVVVVAVVVVLVAVVGVLARLVAGGGSSSGAGGSGGSDLEVRWSVEPRALADDWGYFESVDGAQPGLLPTAGGWVAMVDASTVDAVLGAIDPDDGSVRWSIELPESRCTRTGDDPAAPLTCLTRDDPGDPFQVVSIDPVTGDRVGDPLATTLTEVPVLLAP